MPRASASTPCFAAKWVSRVRPKSAMGAFLPARWVPPAISPSATAPSLPPRVAFPTMFRRVLCFPVIPLSTIASGSRPLRRSIACPNCRNAYANWKPNLNGWAAVLGRLLLANPLRSPGKPERTLVRRQTSRHRVMHALVQGIPLLERVLRRINRFQKFHEDRSGVDIHRAFCHHSLRTGTNHRNHWHASLKRSHKRDFLEFLKPPVRAPCSFRIDQERLALPHRLYCL